MFTGTYVQQKTRSLEILCFVFIFPDHFIIWSSLLVKLIFGSTLLQMCHCTVGMVQFNKCTVKAPHEYKKSSHYMSNATFWAQRQGVEPLITRNISFSGYWFESRCIRGSYYAAHLQALEEPQEGNKLWLLHNPFKLKLSFANPKSVFVSYRFRYYSAVLKPCWPPAAHSSCLQTENPWLPINRWIHSKSTSNKTVFLRTSCMKSSQISLYIRNMTHSDG